jgi:hypothetical protein
LLSSTGAAAVGAAASAPAPRAIVAAERTVTPPRRQSRPENPRGFATPEAATPTVEVYYGVGFDGEPNGGPCDTSERQTGEDYGDSDEDNAELEAIGLVVNLEQEDINDASEDTEVGLEEDDALEQDPQNPGNWPDDAFKERFEGTGANRKSVGRAMPGGPRPVPIDAGSGKRTHKGWEFHYNGWTGDEGRGDASDTDPSKALPKSRQGFIKPTFYSDHSLTESSAKLHDPLFWLFSVLPLREFWNTAQEMTNAYAFCDLKMDGSAGRPFVQVGLHELVRFYGCHLHDGVMGYTGGGLWQRWDKTSCTFSPHISDSLGWRRYEQIKRVFHLCKNSDQKCQSSSPSYDPACKVSLLPETIVSSTNRISVPSKDQTVDETTWGTQAMGPKSSNMCKRIRNKPGVTKGGQHVVMMGCDKKRPRAVVARHNKNDKLLQNSQAEGPNEILLLLRGLKDSGVTIDDLHITADNYFSNEKLFEQMDPDVKATMTLSRNCHPKGTTGCLYKAKVQPHLAECKAARKCEPIVAVKGPNMTVSMMSTGSTNFLCRSGAYKDIRYYGRTKYRGRGRNKRHWDIEMNATRSLYLCTYGAIDRTTRIELIEISV